MDQDRRIPIKEADLRELIAEKWLEVDIRPKSEFQKHSMPANMNIPFVDSHQFREVILQRN